MASPGHPRSKARRQRNRLAAASLAGLLAALYSSLQLIGMVPRRAGPGATGPIPTVTVEGQPLAANIERLAAALDYLGAPLPAELRANLLHAGQARDAQALQQLLDDRVLLSVHINPESRVRVERGADLNFQFTAIEFLSPLVRVTGTGGITRSPSAPDAPLQDQPMNVQLQLGAKGGLATLFRTARVLGTATDDQGFTLLRQPFTIGGTAAKPDASALWRMLATSAVNVAGTKIEGLFKK